MGQSNRKQSFSHSALLALLLAIGTAGQFSGSRLKITNECASAPMWIAHQAHGTVGPDPQNLKIEALQSHDFLTPDGMYATRYWPKMFCDAEGNNCGLGGSGGPQEKCVGSGDYMQCAPPIDTKFEATFNKEGFDYVDVSLVDGWTLPFKMEMTGECSGDGGQAAPSIIDCQGMSFDKCPTNEFISTLGQTISLQAINSFTNSVAGCYSPCTKMIDTKWQNNFAQGRRGDDNIVSPYCCPTPPQEPEQCRAGPIKDTQYVNAVHTNCPGTYSYAYDDAMGLYKCVAPDAYYHVHFYCPSVMQTPGGGSVRRPLWLWALLIFLVALVVAGIVAVLFGARLMSSQQPQHQQPLPHQRMPHMTQMYAAAPHQGLLGGRF